MNILIKLKDKYVAKPYHDLKTPFTVDEKGAFADYIVHNPEKMPRLALGATVLIIDFDNNDIGQKKHYWIAGRIISLQAIAPFNPARESMLYQDDDNFEQLYNLISGIYGPHSHQPMIMKVELTRKMYESESGKKRFDIAPVQRPPSGMSRLFFPNITLNEQYDIPAPTLEEILDTRSKGLMLGMVGYGSAPYQINGDFLEYKLDIDSLDNKHTFIVGESGSGKTVLLKNLAYQIRKHSLENRLIMTDVQGDISQLLLWDFNNILKPKLNWQKKIQQEKINNVKDYFKNSQLIVPITKEGFDGDLQALIELAQRRGVKFRPLSLRLQDLSSPSEVEYLFRTTSEQVPMLLDDLAEGIKNLKDTVSITRLESALTRLTSRNSGSQIKLPTTGVSFYRSTFEAARRALNSLKEYFDLDIHALSKKQNPLDCFKVDGINILYLDHLSQEERFMWEMQLVKWLYQNKKSMSDTYVFIDEAHQIIPQKPLGFGNNAIFDRLRSNFEKLAREGRKFRINLILSTQNPKDLHPIVPEQCPTRVVMKINPKNAKSALLEPELAMIANSFSAGQFWIQSPFNGTPDWVRVHSVAPPVPHEPMNEFRKKLEDRKNTL